MAPEGVPRPRTEHRNPVRRKALPLHGIFCNHPLLDHHGGNVSGFCQKRIDTSPVGIIRRHDQRRPMMIQDMFRHRNLQGQAGKLRLEEPFEFRSQHRPRQVPLSAENPRQFRAQDTFGTKDRLFVVAGARKHRGDDMSRQCMKLYPGPGWYRRGRLFPAQYDARYPIPVR